jgi:hypothetical protein
MKIIPKYICENPNCSKTYYGEHDSRNVHHYCSKSCADSGNGIILKKRAEKLRKLKEIEYLKNPKYCACCNSVLSYNKRKNKFCNHTCSASITTIGRISTNETKKKQSKALREYYDSKGRSTPFSNIYYRTCTNCNCSFIVSGKQHNRVFCNNCNINDKKEYRKLCRMSFNKKDHPELFNTDLINKYGWYSPPSVENPNYTGVTWDHLYPIHLGFLNKVPPEIMKHPANAELIPHSENKRRYQQEKFTISLDKLYERIKLWDAGNRNLPTFYIDTN